MRIIGNNQVLIADTQTSHHLGKAGGGSHLCLHDIVRINNVAAPVDVQSARNVALLVFITSANVLCVLHAIVLHRTHIAAHIDNTQVRVIQVFSQPGALY